MTAIDMRPNRARAEQPNPKPLGSWPLGAGSADHLSAPPPDPSGINPGRTGPQKRRLAGAGNSGEPNSKQSQQDGYTGADVPARPTADELHRAHLLFSEMKAYRDAKTLSQRQQAWLDTVGVDDHAPKGLLRLGLRLFKYPVKKGWIVAPQTELARDLNLDEQSVGRISNKGSEMGYLAYIPGRKGVGPSRYKINVPEVGSIEDVIRIAKTSGHRDGKSGSQPIKNVRLKVASANQKYPHDDENGPSKTSATYNNRGIEGAKAPLYPPSKFTSAIEKPIDQDHAARSCDDEPYVGYVERPSRDKARPARDRRGAPDAPSAYGGKLDGDRSSSRLRLGLISRDQLVDLRARVETVSRIGEAADRDHQLEQLLRTLPSLDEIDAEHQALNNAFFHAAGADEQREIAERSDRLIGLRAITADLIRRTQEHAA